MTKSKRLIRRKILSLLFDHLQEESSVYSARESFLSGEVSVCDVDALLAFRSDPALEELRHALDRLENGTFGVCLGCKSEISQEALDVDPTRRICAPCEQSFVHVTTSQYHRTHAVPH